MKFQLLFLINLIKLFLSENKNVFRRDLSIPIIGWCRRYRGYNVTIYGHVKNRMRFGTTWYPTFISPPNVDATCKMDGVQNQTADAIIECIISSEFKNSDVILTNLTSDDFEDLIINDDEQLINSNVTCEESIESTNSLFFLSFKKTLIFIIFFYYFKIIFNNFKSFFL